MSAEINRVGGDVLSVVSPARLRDCTLTYTISPSYNPVTLFSGSVALVVMPTSWNGKMSVVFGFFPTATRKPSIPDSSSLKPYQ